MQSIQIKISPKGRYFECYYLLILKILFKRGIKSLGGFTTTIFIISSKIKVISLSIYENFFTLLQGYSRIKSN